MSEAISAKPRESVGHRIVRAMLVIIFFQVFWKFGGLIITLLVGSVFGSSPESDAYFFVTETVAFLLQTMCLKLFIPVVVPIFKEQLGQEGEEAAWRFGSTVLVLAAVALALITIGGMLFAPRITSLIAEGFNERQAMLTTRLMRWMFPGVFAVCLATITYALLNSYNIFGYAAAGDAVQKIVWAGIFLVASVAGLAAGRMLDVLAVGFLLSGVAILATHLFGLRSKLRFLRIGLPGLSFARIAREVAILAAAAAVMGAGLWGVRLLGPTLGTEGRVLALQQVVLVAVVAAYLLLLWWRARGRAAPMARFAALLVPLLFGILFAKYRDVITNLFASFTGTGVFSDLKYARKVGEAPNSLIIAALSIAILPHLCELATGRKWNEFGDVMTRTIRSIVIFFVPLAALTVVLRRPIIELLFDRGNWTDYHLYHAGDALGLYILSLPFFAIENPIQQSFFAMQRMWAPTLIGFIGTGFHVLFLFVGIEWLGFGYFAVVALVYVAARAFKNIILVAVMRHHVKILPWRESIVFLAKALAITLVVVVVTHYTYQPLKRLFALDPYRQHEVMIDTFNVELTNWESDNVDDLRIAAVSDDEFKAAFPGLESGRNGHALLATYRRSPRRSAGVRRDLSGLALTRVETIQCVVIASAPTELTFELVTRDRVSFPHPPVSVSPGRPERLTLEVKDFKAGKALAKVVGLWIRDITPTKSVAASHVALAVDNVAIVGSWGDDGTPAFGLDCFEPTAEHWLLGSRRPARIGDTGERVGEPELALHLAGEDKPRTLTHHDLVYYDLAGCTRLSFKARADKDKGPLEVRVLVPHEKSWWEGGPVPLSATVDVKASDRRKSYSVPLASFKPPDGVLDVRRSGIVGLEFDVPEGVDFWLDNVAFVREPKGPRIGRISVIYELFKLIHVAVPSLVAFAAFVALLFILRVEEGRDAWAWLREKALKKIIAKLRRQ